MATTDQVRDCVYNYTSHARRGVDAIESFITEDPILPEAEQVSAALEDVRTALSRVEELVHGDLSQQAARWLDEPATRTTLEKAVRTAGVGGTVRRYREPATWLSKTYRDYEVVRINRCSARLRNLGDMDVARMPFDSWEARIRFWVPV